MVIGPAFTFVNFANEDNGKSVGAEQLYLAESIEDLDGEADLISE